MKNLTELFEVLKTRPFMYIREDNVFLLEAFITGYLLCEAINNFVSDKDQNLKDSFCNWIADKYNCDASYSWSHIIRDLAVKEKRKDEIGVFFQRI